MSLGLLSFDELLASDGFELQYFVSGWDSEFQPVRMPAHSMTLRCGEGRCSAGLHPMIFLFGRDGGCELALSVAWSGNWVIELHLERNGLRLRAGMDGDGFETRLELREEFLGPRVWVTRPPHKKLREAAAAFAA